MNIGIPTKFYGNSLWAAEKMKIHLPTEEVE